MLLCYIHIRYILPVFSLCSSGDEGDVGFDLTFVSNLIPVMILLPKSLFFPPWGYLSF